MIDGQDIFDANILVVDDIDTNVLLLEQMLSESGYQQVTSTMDPFTVVELHRANHYDLILLDLQMPGRDGFQLMEDLKLEPDNNYLSILVITAQIEQKWRSLAAGAKGFIGKPFNIVEIDTCIRNLLIENSLIKQHKM
ncbi:response regulator [Colwellia sp. M166]|jgi:CheY-like chemotaxis protein|uniref:response regulator n=1 Tax=Colwellia sp. M166 TaxID=2583805 RepID=UPI00211EAE17|nr:response regulator [Colwellia sp. M166]UUO25217.1 response regulator [Colwellia sp. M166]|tara:strand:- start:43002 stop:43415 length:414 start_codon:yes stop_codon:yes gene_type:complete